MRLRDMGAPRYYTRSEVAAKFGVAPETVTRWAREGKLPPALRTLGKHRRWCAKTIDAWVVPK